MWPVIERELRGESRHGFTYWLRVLGAAAMLLVTTAFLGITRYESSEGGKLFALQHLCLFCAIWILVPFLVADCISREKREGTLGLLFLTPLTAREIVIAKSLAHGLRAFTLCLAVVPILTVPFLIGGVSWHEVLLSADILFNSFLWAMAAGLLASSRNKVWMRSLLLASVLAFGSFIAFIFLNGFALRATLHGYPLSQWGNFSFGNWVEVFLATATGSEGAWDDLFSGVSGILTSDLLLVLSLTTALSLLALWSVLLLAARNLKHTWQDAPPSARQIWVEQNFCTPVFWTGFFKGWMRHKLDRNPIGWLEQRTWSSRLITWSWLAVVIAVLSYSLGVIQPYDGNDFDTVQIPLSLLLLGNLVLSAAGSFRRERETGILELLLVSPIGPQQIIRGRLRGLWGKFLPAAVLLLGISFYIYLVVQQFGWARRDSRSGIMQLCLFAVAFYTLPTIGLYYSLRCAHFLTALLRTLFTGVGVPWLLLIPTRIFLELFCRDTFESDSSNQFMASGVIVLVVSSVQLYLAWLTRRKLHHALVHRTFALGQASN